MESAAAPKPADHTVLFDTYDLLGYRAAIGGQPGEASTALRSVLRGFGPSAPPDHDLPHFSIAAAAEGWEVHKGALVVHTGEDLLIALANLEWHVIMAALEHRDDLFHLHGAALCLPTRRAGIVLAGDSGFGKTTLTLALMLRGFAPFGDDVSLIEPSGLELQPFRRAFHINDDTWRLLEPLAGATLRPDDDAPAGYFSPPQWAEDPVPVRWVMFPEYRAGQQPQLTRLQPAQAVGGILANTTSLPRATRLALTTATRLAESAECYRFATGDLAASVQTIVEMVYGVA